jgi:DHA1 family multidrug/chloramphenicol efflux transport protein-like MFS transporter
MYLPALPEMMRDLNLNTQEAQLTLTMWFLGSATTPLLMGAISDRFGRRRVLLISGVIYIIVTVFCALVHSKSILLTVRFIQGGMVATMMVSGYAAIHELYHHKEAIRILSLMGSISVLAPALGPLFGALVLYGTSWRGIFLIIAAMAGISISLLYVYMPETLTPSKRQTLDLYALFAKYGRVLGNQTFMLLMCVEGLIFCAFLSWITSGPLLIIDSFHHSALAFGIIQALVFGAYICGNVGVKFLLNGCGVNRLITLGLFISCCGGSLMLVLAITAPTILAVFLVSVVIYSFGAGLCFSPLNRTIIEASDEAMGIRVALFTVFLTGFGALGSALSSLFFVGTLSSLAWIIAIPILSAYFLVTLRPKQ